MKNNLKLIATHSRIQLFLLLYAIVIYLDNHIIPFADTLRQYLNIIGGG